MRLVTFTRPGMEDVRIGAVTDDEVVDLSAWDAALPTHMAALLALGTPGLDAARRGAANGRQRWPLDTVNLKAPIAAPGKVFGIGMNFRSFRDAAQARGMVPPPGQRVWFNRQPNCVNGPSDDIWLPDCTSALDYEGELAIVIGARGRHVDACAARALIAGYTICNDVTMRDWAAKCPLLGKSFDTHAPMGPWLVTVDEVGDPHDLTIETAVNGEVRQRGNTAEMLTDCFALIAELSTITTLQPGDVVLTGTPDGCGVLSTPARYLQVGDTVRVTIDGLGRLANGVVPEPRQSSETAARIT